MTQNIQPVGDRSHEYLHAPTSYLGGYTLDVVRRAVDSHMSGDFRTSSLMADALLRDPSVYAAMLQRCGPLVGLPRTVNASSFQNGRGQSKRAAAEGQKLVNRTLAASDRAPWYSSMAMLGFAVAQQVWTPREDGSFVDVEVVPWPSSCVQWLPYMNGGKGAYVALTTEGYLEIERKTGKWLLFEPHGAESFRMGVMRAIALRVADRGYTMVDRATHSQTVAAPTPLATMPSGMTPASAEGKQLLTQMMNLQNPRAGAVVPHGTVIAPFEAKFNASEVFQTILSDDRAEIVRAILGQDGTFEKAGIYTSPSFEGVRFDIIEQTLECEHDELANGLFAPWAEVNFGTPDVAPDVCADIPDLRQAERSREIGVRHDAFNKAITAYRDNGFEISKDSVAALAAQYNVEPPPFIAPVPLPTEAETITAPA